MEEISGENAGLRHDGVRPPTAGSRYLLGNPSGGLVGEDVLKKAKSQSRTDADNVIYGIYANEDKGLFVRINDFFVDRSKVTLKDKSYFFHMLAVMVDAGIPVVAAVKSLANRSDNLRFRRVLRTVAYNCEHGSTLSDAMSRFDSIFDEAEIGIIKSGEVTGRLQIVLFKLSEQLDSRYDLNMKLWSAAVYPIAVLSVLVLVAAGMLIWNFPTLLALLNQGGFDKSKLPFMTSLLIGIQGVFVGYWWFILAVILVFYGVFTVYVGSDYGAVRWDYFKLKFPLVGSILRKVFVLRFVSILGLLIESGLPVLNALNIAGSSLSNKLYKLKVNEVVERVKGGQKIAESLYDSDFLFPSEVVQMIDVGESSASLARVSEKISIQYQKEVDNSLRRISSVFEPLMILFVGIFVALLALAVMGPIFSLSTVVSS
ncbi:type II secretion system F family protein [Candidatus Peregrinibacteria bacterium]|nr:type II secretion system F family protein [Candidatus Peregrinibacteria bacterium]